MVSGNTESGISVTYDDTNNEFDFNVNDPKITLSGDVTGSATMTNLGNVTISTSVGNDTHTHSFANVTNKPTTLSGYGITDAALGSDVVEKTSNQALSSDANALTFAANTLTLKRGDGTTDTINLSAYLDDTNAARITSGRMASTGIATFERDDETTFDVDMSVLLDTNLSRITNAGWNTGNGVLTLTRNDNSTVTVDPDGRYVQRDGAQTITGTLTLNSATPEIHFNGTSDAGIDMAIKATPEALQFYEPKDGNKVHFEIGDDTGVNFHSAISGMAYLWILVMPPAGSYVTTDSAQALRATDALTVSNDTITLHKADGTSESVTTSDANTNKFINAMAFNTGNGVLTATRNDGGTVTVDLDGRYQLSGSYLNI